MSLSNANNDLIVVDEQAVASGRVRSGTKTISIGIGNYVWDEQTEIRVISELIAAGELGTGQTAIDTIQAYLRDTDFYLHKHQILYRAICEIALRGEQFDVQAIINQIKSVPDGAVIVGGEMELYRLSNTVPRNLETHAKQVVRYSLQRALIAAGNYLAKAASTANADVQKLALSMRDMAQQIASRHLSLSDNSLYSVDDVIRQIDQIAADADNPDRDTGIKIWLSFMQKAFLGWRKNKLYIFAAGTGMGKTMLLLNIALDALRQGKRVLFITLEMKHDELMDRIISIESGIPGLRVQSRVLDAQDMERLDNARENFEFYSRNLYILQLNTPTMDDIRAKLSELRYAIGYDLVCIDYIGTEMIAYPGNYDPDPNRHGNHLWTEMRQMKMEYDVPFVVGAQVNRTYMGRETLRPQRTDIANSSKAENAADALCIFHRESVVMQGGKINHADISIEKNRSGPSSSQIYDLYFDEQTGKISEMPYQGSML